MIFSKYPNIVYANSKAADGNMSFITGDKSEALEERKKFAKKLDINFEKIFTANQIRSNKIIVINKNLSKETVEADGIITNQKGIFLMVKIADCLSIAFYDSKNQAIGLLHAGWEGLAKNIINNAILQMKRTFRTNSRDLIVQISPSIGPCHYGGPPKLRLSKDLKWEKYITKDANPSSRASANHGVDLWQIAQDQLIALGVSKENIFNPKICTFENKKYFSHRRSAITGEPDFRFATILGLIS